MKCIKCGHVLPDDSVFCQYCGSKTTEKAEVKPSVAEPLPVRKKQISQKSSSKVGLWAAICIFAVALGISLLFNYSQHSRILALQNQVSQLQKREENSDDYRKLLSAMQNVNGSNYKTIETLIDNLPAGYEDTDKIRSQYNELKKYISTVESVTLTSGSCDAFREAYANLQDFNSKYRDWNVSDYLKNDIYEKHFEKLFLGRKWSDGTYNLYWYHDNDGEQLSTNLPSNKKSWKNYYFVSKIIGGEHIFGYINQDDPSDNFDAFKIVDVIYSGGTWSVTVYCYANDHTYTLK